MLLVLLIAAAVYAPGLSGGFYFDDYDNILRNPSVQMQTLDLASLDRAAHGFPVGTGRHVAMATIGVNWYLSGNDPYSYKLFNLLVHLLSGVLVFWLVRLLVDARRLNPYRPLPDRVARWLPLFVAAAWLLHPLQVSSVLYVVQRMTLLSGLFLLLGCISYLHARLRLWRGERGWLPPLLAALLLFTPLSILSKENGALLPVFLLVIELALFRGRRADSRTDWRVLSLFGLLLAGGLVVVLGHYGSLSAALHLDAYELRTFTLEERLLTQARVLFFYLKMLLLPTLSDMGLFHDDFPLSQSLLEPATTLFAAAGIALLTVAGVVLAFRAPLIGLGILWYLGGQLMESTVVPLEMVFEHRNYIPSIGIALAVGAALGALARRSISARTGGLLALALIAALTVLTAGRAAQWGDDIANAHADMLNHPTSGRSLFTAGARYAEDAIKNDNDSWDLALALLQRARPMESSISPELTLIIVSSISGRPVSEQWSRGALEKLSNRPTEPSDISSLYNLTECLSKSPGCALPDAQVTRLYEAAIDSVVTRPERRARQNRDTLGKLYEHYLVRDWPRPDAAIAWLHKRVARRPDDLPSRLQLVANLIRAGHRADARLALDALERADTAGRYQGFVRVTSERLKAR